jgi:tRNA pseudouridine55 synthase
MPSRAATRNERTDGLLLVDKPAGMTSHDVVDVARKALRTRRIGHAGTLDPFATGLLVLLVGRATRLLPYLDAEAKVYEARIAFGTETDTDDLHGAPLREAPPPDNAAIDAAIARLTGVLDQIPPRYSAKRVDGERAYARARRGEAVELAPSRVTVHEWRITYRQAGLIDAVITCSGGTYIRSLARDLGRLTGSAAHLAALRRVRSGCFSVSDAVSLDALRESTAEPLPTLRAFPTLPERTLDEAEMQRVRNGNPVIAHGLEGRVALLDPTGRMLALAEREGDSLQPRVVLHG